MSRSIPPPMPVIAPSTTAWTGGTRKASAVETPATQNSASPAASRTSIWRRERSTGCGCQERHEAGGARGGEVAPVAKRLRRAADEQVASDAAGHADGDREHDDAERVEALAHAGDPAAEAEDERSREIQGKDEVGVESRQHGQRSWQDRSPGSREHCQRSRGVRSPSPSRRERR
jgi:hypothetical protein